MKDTLRNILGRTGQIKRFRFETQLKRDRQVFERETGLSRVRARNAATAAPVEPVPELLVSPAPRSQNRTSIVCAIHRPDK